MLGSIMRRAASWVSGNVAYTIAPRPVRGSDAPARGAFLLMPTYVNSDTGNGNAAGEYLRESPFLYMGQSQTLVDLSATGVTFAGAKSPGKLVDPNYIVGTLFQGSK